MEGSLTCPILFVFSRTAYFGLMKCYTETLKDFFVPIWYANCCTPAGFILCVSYSGKNWSSAQHNYSVPEFLRVVTTKNTTVWNVVLCGLVEVYWIFGAVYCLHLCWKVGRASKQAVSRLSFPVFLGLFFDSEDGSRLPNTVNSAIWGTSYEVIPFVSMCELTVVYS
jgi:hypothetical protein